MYIKKYELEKNDHFWKKWHDTKKNYMWQFIPNLKYSRCFLLFENWFALFVRFFFFFLVYAIGHLGYFIHT